MNYAVYTHTIVDTFDEYRLITYKVSQDAQGVKSVALMTKHEADQMAASIGGVTTKMVLPLETDQAL